MGAANKLLFFTTFFIVTLIFVPSAYAEVPMISGDKLLDGIVSTFIYGVIGIGFGMLSFRVIDMITPGDLRQQLAVEKNVALGIVVGLQGLGMAIIIAAAIAG